MVHLSLYRRALSGQSLKQLLLRYVALWPQALGFTLYNQVSRSVVVTIAQDPLAVFGGSGQWCDTDLLFSVT